MFVKAKRMLAYGLLLSQKRLSLYDAARFPRQNKLQQRRLWQTLGQVCFMAILLPVLAEHKNGE